MYSATGNKICHYIYAMADISYLNFVVCRDRSTFSAINGEHRRLFGTSSLQI